MKFKRHGNKCGYFCECMGILSNHNIVSCSNNRYENTILRIWDQAEGELIKSVPTEREDPQSMLVLTTDLVAVSFENLNARIVDLEDDEKSRALENCHEKRVLALVLLSSSYLLRAGMDKLIKVWDLKIDALIQSISYVHSSYIRSLSISLFQEFLASTSDEKTIKIWKLV